jgi:hypothetical protein
MQVVGTGFGRTGTLSLKRALERLGFGPTYHMDEVLRRPAHLGAWVSYARGEPVDLGALLGGFRSTVDYPACIAWRSLVDLHPAAKVVHTVRDPEAWYASTRATLWGGRTMLPFWLRALIRPAGDYAELNERLLWQGIFGGRFLDRDHAIRVFEQHTASVVAGLDPERLLVFDVAEGWEPLCAFLGVPVPDEPFPHVNDTAWMRRRITAVRVGTRALPAVAAGAAVAARHRIRASGHPRR